MPDNDSTGTDSNTNSHSTNIEATKPAKATRRRAAPPPVVSFMAPPEPVPAAARPRTGEAGPSAPDAASPEGGSRPAKATRARRGAAKQADADQTGSAADAASPDKSDESAAAAAKATKATRAARPTKAAKAAKATKARKKAADTDSSDTDSSDTDSSDTDATDTDATDTERAAGGNNAGPGSPLFEDAGASTVSIDESDRPGDSDSTSDIDRDSDSDDDSGSRRRRGRRGRGRGKSGDGVDGADVDGSNGAADGRDAQNSEDGSGGSGGSGSDDEDGEGGTSTRRRRRRRRRSDEDDGATSGNSGGGARGDSGRGDGGRGDGGRGDSGRGDGGGGNEEVRGISGSTRLEAKRQRRRDGRDTGRRRAPILSEAEFLARREAVDRAMVIRQSGERTQIAVLEDDIVVEHYITQASANSFAGNVYLGKVQNVLPSMEAAFVDIGKGRNAVLYAGEVNWDAAGLEGKSRNIETAMKSGDGVVVQVTKDPMGHKGARLTSQISLPGRYLVFVPNGSMTGISRKLPDVERSRLKAILKKIVPEDAGVIIRTAAEGASEEELTRDVNRLTAQWEVIQKKAASSSTSSPSLLYQEPDLAIRVIRDVFNEDFTRMVVSGDEAWDTVEAYVAHVAPDLADRVVRHTGESDVFADLRIDEQLAKALDRKVWLPSGGSLVIDRTEAMTVVDVNTGKYVGSGGNLEQTVTRNNLEAAEEIVRQLRLRDVGGIIVIDFIDMVLESNRDLVLRRLTECLGRDRTRHQVAEVTSLGLVQMTRKRVGQGLLEVYSEPCEHCNGRGIIVHVDPVDDKRRRSNGDNRGDDRSDRGGRGGDKADKADKADRADRGDRNGSDWGDRNGSDRGDTRTERSGGRGRGRGSGGGGGGGAARTEQVSADSTSEASPTPTLNTTPSTRQAADEQSPVVAPSDTAVTSSEGAPEQVPASGSGRTPVQPAAAARSAPPAVPERAESDDVLAWTEQAGRDAGPAVTATPRRRGRRGASRPAGPPGGDV